MKFDYMKTYRAIVLAVLCAQCFLVPAKAQDVVSGDDVEIPLPFISVSRQLSLGNAVVIRGEELEKYSSTDIRNALTAIAPGVEVTEKHGGPGVSPLEHIGQYGASARTTVTSRGRTMMYMVDDIPVHINETPLDPHQIESITIVRDVLDKTLYGATAAEGIVYIRTKRGHDGERWLNVEAEAGVNVVDRMPEWVSGSDYARLNNIARVASGMPALYKAEDVLKYQQRDPYSMTHPNVDFRQMMFKNVMHYSKASVSSGGGNANMRYNAYLGYAGEDDIYKIGPAADYNRVNISANLDINLHRYVKARFGIISTLGVRRSANYGYDADYSSEDGSSNSTLGVTEFPSIINHVNTIPAIAFPIYANNDPSLESPWYAVSTLHTQNPVANILENGSYTETIRKGLMNVGVDVDFSFLTPGLTSSTYVAYDATNLVRLGIVEDYAAYFLTPGIDEDGNDIMIPQQSSSHSVKSMANKAKLLDYFSSRLYLNQTFAYQRTFGKHAVAASARYMITRRTQKFITEHRREMNFGFNAMYAYDNRYTVQTSMNWHGTYSLLNNPWSYSPSIGAGWIISEEGFMKDVKGIDFLKIRVQGGLLHYDALTSANRDVDNYKWDADGQKFGPHTNNQWFGSSQSSSVDRVYPQMLGNADLRLERRYEATAGIDMRAFDNRLDMSLTYWYTLSDGPITQMTNVLPLYAGVSSGALWMNYNKTWYQGGDLSLTWKDRIGDFFYSVSGWASTRFSKILRIDELDYKDPYRSKVGCSSSAIWGLRCLGQFQSDDEALRVPQMFDDQLHAGDLKYQDMNGDGLVDDTDACVIGDTTPRLIYGLNIFLKYKDFDLTLAGTGRAFYDVALTNEYFWNGWSDGNYSKFVFDNAGNPGHPRLTYNKVNNNFKTSTFWLRDGSFFKLQTVEFGYELPVARWSLKFFDRIRVYVRGNNLLTISKIGYVDPESINAGVTDYPLMRTFTGGLKLTF